MRSFKSFVSEAHQARKQAFRYDPKAGDRERVLKSFLQDKRKLTASEKLIMRHFFRSWKASRGATPIFEPKFVAVLKDGKAMLYGIEIQKRLPPFHVVGIRTQSTTSGANLFTWIRIFTNYDEYSRYLSTLSSASGR